MDEQSTFLVTKAKGVQGWVVMARADLHKRNGERALYYVGDDLKQVEWACRTYEYGHHQTGNMPHPWRYI